MKFIHISDLHFGKTPDKIIEDTLSFINLTYPKHKLIITGDIVNDGEEVQFNRAYTALVPFIADQRIFICPGNHDFGEDGVKYSYERAERFDRLLSEPLQQGGTFAGDNDPVVNIPEADEKVVLIALDTNLQTYDRTDLARGWVGATQLSWLNDHLMDKKYDNHVKILFFHHHPFIHTDPILVLEDADELMHAISNKVDVVCFGHKHRRDFWQDYEDGDIKINYVLASDNSPGKEWAWEIDITHGVVTAGPIKIGLVV
jgi:3',5'-cyclic AMP phosphodiesterase CpdA